MRTQGELYSVVATEVMTGTVKWFSDRNKYGFLATTGEDILFGIACLEELGVAILSEGATVRCEAYRTERGLRARRFIAVDESTAVSRTFTPNADPPYTDWLPLKVKQYNRYDGYGFFYGPNGRDVFVHAETLKQCRVRTMRVGQTFLVRCGNSGKGLIAVEIKAP